MERLVFHYPTKVYVLEDGRFIPLTDVQNMFADLPPVEIAPKTDKQTIEEIISTFIPGETKRDKRKFQKQFPYFHLMHAGFGIHSLTFIAGKVYEPDEISPERLLVYTGVVNR